MTTRARKNHITVLLNSLAGRVVDITSLAPGRVLAYDEGSDQYIHLDPSLLVTYEALDQNGDVGPGSDQLARGDHDHEVGDLVQLFNNQLI